MMNEVDKQSITGGSLDSFTTDGNKAGQFIKKAIPGAVILILTLFIAATAMFVWQNSHFIGDDIWHISRILKRSWLGFILEPQDVHFIPLHKLATLLIYKISPLDFRIALGFLVAVWIAIIVITHRVLIRLTSNGAAWMMTLFLGSSPLWLPNLIWWSSAMHRVPYLLFQAAAFLAYLRYRERGNGRDALLCVVMQILCLGFYMKAIFYPLMLAALEMCLVARDRHISKAGMKLCGMTAAVSMIYLVWYYGFAPVLRPPHNIDILNFISSVFVLLSRLGSLLLFLPIDRLWSALVSGAFWLGLAIFCIWRRPGNTLPIAALLVLLLMNCALNVAGRNLILFGVLFVPEATMRYYLEQIVIIGIFAALVIGRHGAARPSPSLDWRRYGVYALLLIFMVIYPTASYLTNRVLFVKMYDPYKKTHDFMVNLNQNLQKLSSVQPPPTIAHAIFPFHWSPLLMIEEIFGPLYPKLQWGKPEDIGESILTIGFDGSIVPGNKCDQFVSLGPTRDSKFFMHKSPDFTLTGPKEWTTDYVKIPTVVLNRELEFSKFLVIVADLNKYPVGYTMKDAPKLSCSPLHKILQAPVTNCRTLYERDIKLKDGTSAYEYEVKWETPKFPKLVFYTYRVVTVRDKKSIEVEVGTIINPVSDDLKKFPLSLAFK